MTTSESRWWSFVPVHSKNVAKACAPEHDTRGSPPPGRTIIKLPYVRLGPGATPVTPVSGETFEMVSNVSMPPETCGCQSSRAATKLCGSASPRSGLDSACVMTFAFSSRRSMLHVYSTISGRAGTQAVRPFWRRSFSASLTSAMSRSLNLSASVKPKPGAAPCSPD